VVVPPHEACMGRAFVADAATMSKKSGELTQVKDFPAAGIIIGVWGNRHHRKSHTPRPDN